MQETGGQAGVERGSYYLGSTNAEIGESCLLSRYRIPCYMVGGIVCRRNCYNGSVDDSCPFGERATLDGRISSTLEQYRYSAERAVIIHPTASRVGFANELEQYDGITRNPGGWNVANGFEAFFSRAGESSVIGCDTTGYACVRFDFLDGNGRPVVGFEQGTARNMLGYGEGKYAFRLPNGKPVTFTHFVLDTALRHYQADPYGMTIRVCTAMHGAQAGVYSGRKMVRDKYFPGWYECGFLQEITLEGSRSDSHRVTWAPDAYRFVLSDIFTAMGEIGIPIDNSPLR